MAFHGLPKPSLPPVGPPTFHLSALQENNFLWFQKDTKMKYQDYVRPRLVVAFADLALSERDRIVEDAFFHEPAKALYSYGMHRYDSPPPVLATACLDDEPSGLSLARIGCLIEACDIVLKLDRPDKAERAKIHMLKDGLQAKLVHLFAFIDCPLDEDGDGNLDYKSKSHRPLIDHVLCSPNGWLALKQMATADCQHFLGDDELQPFFTRHYHGSLLTQLLVETTGEGQVAFTWRIMVLRWAIFLFWTFVNCFIFAPLIATSGMFFGRTLWIDSRKKRLYAHWHEDRSIRSESGFDYGEKNPDATGPNQPELKFGIQRFLSPACYMLEEPWMTGMLRGVAELGQVLLLGSLRTIPQETLPFWIRLNCVWYASPTEPKPSRATWPSHRHGISLPHGPHIAMASLCHMALTSPWHLSATWPSYGVCSLPDVQGHRDARKRDLGGDAPR